MNELASLGLILLFALLVGHLVKYLRIPEVTGYIFAGILVGPSVLHWVRHENLAALGLFSEVALGLILFSIGLIFDLRKFRTLISKIAGIVSIEALLTGFLVYLGMWYMGQSWQASLLLGVTAMETAAASTMMVIRECNATGPLTEVLTGYIAVNNILTLSVFSIVLAFLAPRANVAATPIASDLFLAIFPVVWQLVGSLALGFLVGLLLASWSGQAVEHGEILILLIGCVLLAVGMAIYLDLSPLVTSLAVGATMVNLSRHSSRTFDVLSRTDPPFYAIFFVIAGADLDFTVLKTVGILGPVYVLARMSGKLLGSHLGARQYGLPEEVRRLLGFTILSQAGLAVGLTIILRRTFPDFGPSITAIILAAVLVHEIIGPISTRVAILRSGESQPDTSEPLTLME